MNNLIDLINEEQRVQLLNLPQVASLPQDQKSQALDAILEQILGNILTRLSQALTEADMQKIEEMSASKEANSETIKYYLLTKVPNLDEIVKEEVSSYQG